jgi:hypothetical protein
LTEFHLEVFGLLHLYTYLSLSLLLVLNPIRLLFGQEAIPLEEAFSYAERALLHGVNTNTIITLCLGGFNI